MILASATVLAMAGPIAAGLAAQSPAGGAAPVFEVASVKPAAPTNLPDFWYRMTGGPGTPSPGQFTCTHIALKPLLIKAYDLRPYELIGPPSIDGDKYDIEAKIPPGTTKEQFNLMLQNLLVERFGLAAHRETRELPIYELTVAKGGLKMKEPEKPPAGEAPPAPPEPGADGRPPTIKMLRDKDGSMMLPPGAPNMIFYSLNGVSHVSARMQTIASLLRSLENQLGRAVVDKTGLTGSYDFNMTYAPDRSTMVSIGPPAAPEPPSGQPSTLDTASDPVPNLFAAFESQLGLKLESKKGPIEVLVVDKVNRTPTEN
jgi:uncharacterized protein (TIGR03435 family)